MAPVLPAALAALPVVMALLVVRLRARARRAEERLDRYRVALEHLPAGLVMLDRSLRTQLATGRGLQAFGLDGDTIGGRRLHESVSPDVGAILDPVLRAALEGQQDRLQVPAGARDHSVQVVPVPAADGGVAGVVVVLQDVTERRRTERDLSELASRDGLTGLWNRRSFERELERLLSEPRRGMGGGVVLLVDLDDFKRVNDTLGHRAGDELLHRVARALESSVRRTDVVARLGGDEFAVLLPGLAGREADGVAAKVSAAVASVWPPGLRGGASVGIGVAGEPHLTPASVLAAADRAMYALKHARRLAKAS